MEGYPEKGVASTAAAPPSSLKIAIAGNSPFHFLRTTSV